MEVKRYRGKFNRTVQYLHDQGVLSGYPVQVERTDLIYDEGVDVIYRLKGMTPAKFENFSGALLLAAFLEAERYKEVKYKFAKFQVRLNRTTKGRKMVNPIRDYTAAKHPDSEIMVYGEEALGYTLPDEYTKRPFLVNKVSEILGIPDSPSPGPYIKEQVPYRVLYMIVSLRAGLNERVRE